MRSKTKICLNQQTLFKFEEETFALIGSAISVNIGQDAVIIGETGKIIVPSFLMADKAMLYDNDGKLVEDFTEKERINGYEHEIREVNQCLRNGKLESSILPLKDMLEVIRVMDSIRAKWGLKYAQESD